MKKEKKRLVDMYPYVNMAEWRNTELENIENTLAGMRAELAKSTN